MNPMHCWYLTGACEYHSASEGTLKTLRWRHNDQDDVSNHQPHGCLLNRLFRRRSNKTSKLRVTGLCVGNSPGPVNSPHKGPVTRKMFPFDDVIMNMGQSIKESIGKMMTKQSTVVPCPYFMGCTASINIAAWGDEPLQLGEPRGSQQGVSTAFRQMITIDLIVSKAVDSRDPYGSGQLRVMVPCMELQITIFITTAPMLVLTQVGPIKMTFHEIITKTPENMKCQWISEYRLDTAAVALINTTLANN